MKKRIRVVLPLALVILLTAAAAPLPGLDAPPETLRERAQTLYNDGNYAEAFALYEALLVDPANSGILVGNDLDMAVTCLRSLNRVDETDGIRERAVEAHREDWRLLWRAAESYFSAHHYGTIVAGEFRRGHHRGGGRYVNSFERDRTRALQLMEKARGLAAGEPVATAVAQLHRRFAATLLGYRGYQGAWRLQYLTDLGDLPDYGEGNVTPYARQERGAPVDAEGRPVFHYRPESFERAATDGERWRWLLWRAADLNPVLGPEVKMDFAAFLTQQFGVQTMSGYGDFSGGRSGGGETEAGRYAVHTLSEDETIARLASGVQRFTLPEEFNFIRIRREVAGSGTGQAEAALNALSQIFENRRQYETAAELLRRNIREFGDHSDWKRRRLEQITGNWGQFEPVMTHPAGQGATVEYRYRNGRRVSFEAHRIKVRKLLDDLKEYLRDNPRKLDRDRMIISEIGYRLVSKDEKKYLHRRVARWDLELDPPEGHFDRSLTVATPLQEAGAYLLTARLDDGNTSRIVIWVTDTAIVRKRLDGGNLFFVADAVSGEPLGEVKVDFFGYDQERTDWQKLLGRRYNIRTRDFSYRTDGDGQLVPNAGDFDDNYNWIISASTPEGRFAYLGWSRVWTGRRYDREYNEQKYYTITDRPVYRPDQPVKFKIWVRQAKYDQEGTSRFANRPFTVRIDNPRAERVFEESLRSDEWGGISGEYLLPADAMLGAYRIYVPKRPGSTFRVEEYKKPEFEVTVESPEKPVMLGETVTAAISANYYFGAPVTEAKVRYKVLRSAHTARWYPASDWDWFYGPGYWWFQPDYRWYPRWSLWGVEAPFRWWWPAGTQPPEIVAEAEVPVGPDGRVEVKIDTSFAREVHGDEDHRYEIIAEVTDRSRRTIVGRGELLVARQPFRVYAWVDRGHYRRGDVVQAEFSARTLDGSPVKGSGELRLLKIDYEKGEPKEMAVQHWALDTDDGGRSRVQIKASAAGQYRLSYRVDDGEGHVMEGGYIFAVRGSGFDGKQYRFNEIEIVPDRKEYAAGDRVRLMVNTDRPGSTVLLFVRPANGIYLRPRTLRLRGKSTLVEIDVTKKDMPNFFVEALTVSGGRVHSETREIVVPPEKRVLNVELLPSAEKYRPGEKASVRVKVSDHDGLPFAGSAVMSVYDKSVEYISGGSNVPEIRAFFWKWRRQHRPYTESSFDRRFGDRTAAGELSMQPLGVFGTIVGGEAPTDAFGDRSEGFSLGAAKSMMEPEVSMTEAAPALRMMRADSPGGPAGEDRDGRAQGKPAEPAAADVEPTLRSEFADTAFWEADLVTDARGVAEVEFEMPENLTGWKIRTWALGHGTVVGEATAEAVTFKNLILRLQAPRFFVERDEVVLSANIHNYLEHEKPVRALLELDGGSLQVMGPATQRITVPAGGEERVDWRVKVVREGEAVVRMKAITDEESDAVEMRFPAYVHGMLKTESISGVVRPEGNRESFTITVPAERRAEQTRLEMRYSPTLAGAMVDALPYLVGYPYGCTEQTLNRFLPTVITQKILLETGVDLKDIRDKRTNLNAQEIGDDPERAKGWKRWSESPVFDEERVRDMVRAGVQRLAVMQLSDGGWGWFSGWNERSYPHTTATVVHGLQVARENGARLLPGMLERGEAWLEGYQREELRKLRNADGRKKPWKARAGNLDALVYMVLVDAGRDSEAMRDFLYRDRTHLSVYALAMFGMALHRRERAEELAMVLRNIEQYLVEDAENQTAWLNLPGGYWWYWYGSEYEAHAYYLKLLARTEPGSARSAGLVKYLLNNRKHATYWNSTRDTALSIEAMADYLRASGEERPDMTVEIFVDGRRRKSVRITPENLFSFDNRLILEGRTLSSGDHRVEIRRSGTGPVYFNAYLTNFTLEDHITKAGLEIKVERKYYRLERVDKTVKDSGSRGQVVDRKVEKYRRVPLENLSELTSGDLVEIELEIESKNDYEYVVFEDMKAAGFEPVEVRSGYGGNDLGAYMELRDERVVFFVRALARGKHSVAYRMRAEIPGKFSALPTRAHAMYAPELKANSDEIKLRIRD